MLNYKKLQQHQKHHNLPKLVSACVCLCFSAFYYGFCLNQTSTISREIYVEYYGEISVQPVMSGILIGILALGGGVGALIAPLIINFIPSRKYFLLLFNSLAILVAGVIQIDNFVVLMTCRFFQGFVIGNCMGVVPAYIKQITPKELRGTMGAMSQFFIVGGGVSIFSLQVIFVKTGVSNQFFWRFMFSFTGITVIIQSIMLLFNLIPQSPLSCIEAGNQQEAMDILKQFNNLEGAKVIFDQFVKISKRKRQQYKSIQLSTQGRQQFQIDSIDKNIIKQKQKPKIVQNNQTSWKMIVVAFQLPLMQQFNGNKPMSAQASMILSQYNQNLGLYAPLITNSIMFFAIICSFYIISKFGRRPIILVGNLALSIICFVLGVMFLALFHNGNNDIASGAMIFIVLFMFVYGITVGPIVWLYVPEIAPPRIVPFATFNYWVGVAVSMAITPIVIGKVGSSYPLFFFFGGISLIFFIMNFFLVVETRVQNIQEENINIIR